MLSAISSGCISCHKTHWDADVWKSETQAGQTEQNASESLCWWLRPSCDGLFSNWGRRTLRSPPGCTMGNVFYETCCLEYKWAYSDRVAWFLRLFLIPVRLLAGSERWGLKTGVVWSAAAARYVKECQKHCICKSAWDFFCFSFFFRGLETLLWFQTWAIDPIGHSRTRCCCQHTTDALITCTDW